MQLCGGPYIPIFTHIVSFPSAVQKVFDAVEHAFCEITLSYASPSRHGTVDTITNLAYDVVQMPPSYSLGEFEQVVLLAILRMGEDGYGVTIRREIATCTGRDPSPGALYTTLDRLEEKGLVTSTMSDPTPARGGRSKRDRKSVV